MKHVIIGTAGHVDHGKTVLIKALTGITPTVWQRKSAGASPSTWALPTWIGLTVPRRVSWTCLATKSSSKTCWPGPGAST